MSITLTSSMQSNLLNLQGIAADVATTQLRLSTGRKVNSASDNAAAYFSAQQGFNKATALDSLKSDMGEALQKIQTALTATTAAVSVLKQMKSLADQAAATSDTATQATLQTQYNALKTQLDTITQNDANYKGTNLLSGTAGNDLTVKFNETGTSSITIAATDTSTATYEPGTADFTTAAGIKAASDAAASATTAFQGLATTLGTNNSFIQTRSDFTSQLSGIFTTGANNLVNADMNQESANMLALQTRQQLSISALSLASQANSAVLHLFP